MKNTIPNSSKIIAIKLVAWLVGITGAWIVYSPLHEIFFDSSRRLYALSLSATAMPLFIGSTIIYLATLLHRRKRGAWLVSIGVFGYTAGFLTLQMILHGGRHIKFLNLASLILILMSLAFLYVYRGEYTVKSSPKSFWHASKKALLFMVMTFVFGVAGFMYLDHRDFNANIGIFDAVKYTYQELNFFTDSGILASTNRGKLFIDSLNTVGVISAFYMIVSLFSPIKSSLHSDESDRLEVIELLKKYPENTEDFFKIWPKDKQFYFNDDRTATIAYKVKSGVALTVGEPLGDPHVFEDILQEFDEFCRLNDWQPSAIHISKTYSHLYKNNGYKIQKIGEEAMVDIDVAIDHINKDKNFRHIRNKFTKLGYSVEIKMPPHSDALNSRLTSISDDWLEAPGRAERIFMMGSFEPEYLQLCPMAVLRDDAGTIQAFINLLVIEGNDTEANYDMLRQSKVAIGNSNDFLMLSLIVLLQEKGYKKINMGLCPLSGIKDLEEKGLIDNAMRFAYANGDKFYSFSGLQRFKSKFQPEWQSRYIAYRGGIPGFIKTTTALIKAMKP